MSKLFFILIGLVMSGNYLHGQDFAERTLLHRDAYKKEFLQDKRAPLDSADVQQLHFFEPDSQYAVVAKVSLVAGDEPIVIPTYSGVEKNYLRYARRDFQLNGEEMSLYLYKSVDLASNPLYADYLFLPFTDVTNDKETYGGGRYLDFKLGDIVDGKLIVDFNKAYNPYCAYSSGYNCPIPPKENSLSIAILAGEQKYTGAYKKRKD
ncbi:DUF1684 domain-containing protein [Olivibacter sitiensis]|uniref:DUF1684 domain-containing protein n=1 Tax=Olivibacter sitiensis TaxID=376470 RepID=UPI0004228797|nr:DUF1684 domain-containing protein [Olivibacter sitiensis]